MPHAAEAITALLFCCMHTFNISRAHRPHVQMGIKATHVYIHAYVYALLELLCTLQSTCFVTLYVIAPHQLKAVVPATLTFTVTNQTKPKECRHIYASQITAPESASTSLIRVKHTSDS